MKRICITVALLVVAASAHAAGKLTIMKAGPVGEIAQIAEANEIRVVFTEPMVVVGKIPKIVAPSWFHISPAVKGSFRWSGTTTLILTPEPNSLPFATKFDVTIDADAKSVAGNTLDRAYTFSFITPTIQLLQTNWYRKENRFDAPVIVALRFNQPVDPQTILQHLQLRTKAHELKAVSIPESGVARLKGREPQALQAFEEKKAKAQQAASADRMPVLVALAEDWDKTRFKPSPDLVVLETKPGVPPETHIQVYLDAELAHGAKNVRTGRVQEFTIELTPAFFVDLIDCLQQCDPESWNPIRLRVPVRFSEMVKALSVVDVTDPASEKKVTPNTPRNEIDPQREVFSLDELGYSIQPAHSYALRIDPSLTATDGQKLGYTWMGVVEYWHKTAFTSFGDGNGVWESSGGPLLPFHARNFKNVKQWLAPVAADQLMPTLLDLEKSGFTATPKGEPRERKLAPVADKIQSYGLDVSPALGPNGKGLVWAAVEEGEPIARSRTYYQNRIRATLVQVTNLGISVKDSPQNTLILVTRLDNAAAVAGASVSIRNTENRVVWNGTTDAQGIAIAPNTNLRLALKEEKKAAEGDESTGEEENWESTWNALQQIHFLVIAEKEGDVAYASSNWHEGISPWDFGVDFNLRESQPLLRGTIFTDRGVYKLGEDVHVKAILRSDTPAGMQLLPPGTKVDVVLSDSHDQEVEKRSVTLSEWSSAEWAVRIPGDRPLGMYRFIAKAEGRRLRARGEFLVAAYRRPDFRVDVDLNSPTTLAGTKLDGRITARYLFGAPMSRQPVKWTYAKRALFDVPAAIRNRFPEERFAFLGWDETRERNWTTIESKEQKLDAKGELKVTLATELAAGWPYEYRLEGEVTDVSRQKIANRTAFRVDPAPWYIGVKSPSFFADTAKGIDTEIVAAALDGSAVPGVGVQIELTQIQWNSVRRAEGNGFYTWETERKDVPSGSWSATTQAQPAPLHIDVPRGGFYYLTATAHDAEGRSTKTKLSFYAVGGGYTAWERYDHNRIDLVPEKKRYRPGETARIMIKSPWERATALLTTEREGVRTWKQFELTSTQQTITVPITEREIPNVFVSVLLVKGRTKEGLDNDESDPGKPSFRLGYAELEVEDATKRLAVEVKANRDEYRPATKARIDVSVRDNSGKGTPSEVTLWAVDYGVLSLTAYRTPEVINDIYLRKALQVVTEDSREKIVSRRVLTPKGASEGGGGGRDAGPGMLRKDFRVLAFWLGSVTTDRKGRARSEVTLPESLTTYRIMAVAADKQSRFGWAQSEIRISKPLLLTPAFPRFLAVGDKALFGSVVHSQLKGGGTATVMIRSLDPEILEITGEPKSAVNIEPNGSAEVRFNAVARAIGDARVQMTVSMLGENDGFEDTIPVRVLVSPESVAAYGSVGAAAPGRPAGEAPSATQTVEIPSGVVPTFGGLHFELASTAMVGLGEGARYLVEYPYGCAEQRASAALALMLTSDLGDAFRLPGIDPKSGRATAQATLSELAKFQCGDGGFAFWPGECWTESPYLTSYVLRLFQRGQKLGYSVDKAMLERAYDYLERNLAEKRPQNEGWWPAYTAWQAFAVKVLVEGGRNEDSHVNRLSTYADRMPVFGIAYLADALIARGERSQRLTDLHRRISNAILPEGGSAHVEELTDPYLLWFWNSNIRSTAIVLGTLVRQGEDEEMVRRMVRWLMAARKKGRWGNTQENAWAMEALVDYYRKYEAEVPDFMAEVTFGRESVVREPFKGRSTEAKSRDFSMRELLTRGKEGEQIPVTFERDGAGTLFYLMRLRYASAVFMHEAFDQGFRLERHYALQSGSKDQKTFKAGDLIQVTLRIRNTKERRFVAISDPIPAGTEPVESWFATTAAELADQQSRSDSNNYDWMSWWKRGGWDHVERHDDHVNLFATRLSEGTHEYTYLLRATTAGTFVTAPLHAEEMYEPEVFGRTATDVVEVKP